MNRHHNIGLSGFLVATLAISTILALTLTGCTPQATTIPTITAVSPVATIQATAQATAQVTAQATAQANATLAPTLAATLSVPRAASLLILHTNDVSGYVDPCG